MRATTPKFHSQEVVRRQPFLTTGHISLCHNLVLQQLEFLVDATRLCRHVRRLLTHYMLEKDTSCVLTALLQTKTRK